jgi:murein DD-endopeptidase MepM/ murein hydrolase activator NlpD
LYCHNQTVLVSEGETVLAGQAIATLGSTGKSSGPHCHFELWFAGENLDPALVFQAMYQAQKQQDSASIETPVSYRVPDTQTLQVSGSDRDVADHALD